jgi:hypothetical protein
MPEIPGEFRFVRWVRPEEKVGRWESKFASAPDVEWKTLFEYDLAVEASHSGNSAGISRTIEGATITFDSPDSWAKAAADMIRRTAQKTDNRMVDLRRRQRNETEARQRQAEWRAEELRASEEKHRKL